MKLRRFCAKCGKEISGDDRIFEGFVCAQCHGKETTEYQLPKTLQLRQCFFCHAFSLRNPEKDQEFKWVYHPEDEGDLDFVTRLLYEHIFFQLEQKHKLTYDLFLSADVDLTRKEDIIINVEVKGEKSINYPSGQVIMKFRQIHCPHCAQRQGGRFDAIVQIRIQHDRDKARLEEVLQATHKIEKAANIDNLHNYICKVEPTINGVDLKVSTNVMARVLISQLRALYPFEIKYSKRLMGINHENGTRLYRQSTLLRLVPVSKGEEFTLEGVEYRVHNLTRKKVILEDIHSHKLQHVNFDIFQKKSWFIPEKDSQSDVEDA